MFVGAVYKYEPTKSRSTTIFSITFSGGAVVYRYKNHLINELSSTEPDLFYCVTVAKTNRFLKYMLRKIRFPQ